MTEKLHPLYLPFTRAQLHDHFAPVGADTTSADRHLDYYEKSARAAKAWDEHPPEGTPAQVAKETRRALQIQKDERFWVVTTLLQFFNAADRRSVLAELLRGCLGDIPPIEGPATWEQALGDAQGLRLFFEVSLPTPQDYRPYLAGCLDQRVLIPHVLDSAKKAERAGKALEGTTRVDAVLIAPGTGFAVLFEAKVLADASSSIGFDVIRNQIARNIDVMLDRNPQLREPLSQRRPDRTCFVLITPQIFRDHPQSRLYGWLMNEYQHDPNALQRDLRHRTETDFTAVAARLGWLTWEDCNHLLPGACPWLDERRNCSHADPSSIALLQPMEHE